MKQSAGGGLGITLIVVVLAAGDLRAQEIVDPANALRRLPGQNAAQNDMANSIDRVCPTLVDRQDQLEGDARDLQEVCTRMIRTARVNLGELPDDADNQFGLDADETNAALQSISGEELQSPQSRVTEIRDIQLGALQNRIEALRSGGVGPGVNVSGLNFDLGDTRVAFNKTDDYIVQPAQWPDEGFLSRLGVFITGTLKFGDKDATGQSEGFDFDSQGITVGVDYRITNQAVAGLALGYANFDADFDETTDSPGGQELDSDTFTASIFGTYNSPVGVFADAIATVGFGEYDSERRIVIPDETGAGNDVDRTAEGEFDTLHYGLAGNLGYDLAIDAFTLTPLARAEFIDADIDGFTEDGAGGLNLEFDDQDAESFTINLGGEASYALSTGVGVFVPSVRAEYVHEFLNDDDGVQVVYANDPTGLSAFEITTETADEDYGIIGAALTATFPRGWGAFVDYETVVGLSHFDIHRINFGLRKSF